MEDYDNLLFSSSSDFIPEVSTVNLVHISEWNLIMNAYSKSPEIGLLQKIANSEVSLFDLNLKLN